MSLDEVVTLYVTARRGQTRPQEQPRRAVKILLVPTLPGDADCDAGDTTDIR